jgi:hypothetical protein
MAIPQRTAGPKSKGYANQIVLDFTSPFRTFDRSNRKENADLVAHFAPTPCRVVAVKTNCLPLREIDPMPQSKRP